MNCRGQGGVEIVGAAVAGIFAIIIIGMFLNAYVQTQCQGPLNQVNELNDKVAGLEKDLNAAREEANFWHNEFDNIDEITITKKDITELKQDLNAANITINNTQTRISTLNQEFNDYQITIFYFVLSLAIAIPLLSMGFMELSLFKLERIKKIWKVNIRRTHYLALNEHNEVIIVPYEK